MPESAPEWVILGLAIYGGALAAAHTWQFLRRLFRPPAPLAIGLLVLVRNQEHQIEGFIRTLAGMAKPAAEVLVVDGGSRDQTPLILQRLCRQIPGLRLISLPHGGRPGQSPCEVGLCATRSRVVLLLDLRGTVEALPLLETVRRLLGERSDLEKKGCT